MFKALLLLFSLSASLLGSTKSVYQIWQPLSLAGTDVYGVLGVENTHRGTAVLPRPVVVTGAIPEDLVAAIALNIPIASATKSYTETQVNLLALAKVQLQASVEKGILVIRFDVSEAEVPKALELSLEAIVELGIDAVQKTVVFNGQAQAEHTFLCNVEIVGAKVGSPLAVMHTSFAVDGPKGE